MPCHAHHTTAAADRMLHHGLEGGHLPAPTDQSRFSAGSGPVSRLDGQQQTRRKWLVMALDEHQLGIGEDGSVLD